MGHDSWWRFDLVAQISGAVQGGDVLTNRIEAYGDSPDDVEPDYGNNKFELPITILGPRFEVSKTYESSRVPGTVVTYTVTVTNVGTEAATNVVVTDALPAGLTYGGSDGAFDGSDVSWTFGTMAAHGGTASGWFRATLPSTAGLEIVNDDYGVRGCDQGVSGPAGAPVRFTVESRRVILPLVLRNA
jgi:uncharacterized repeat protein (TIGR01451 family)